MGIQDPVRRKQVAVLLAEKDRNKLLPPQGKKPPKKLPSGLIWPTMKPMQQGMPNKLPNIKKILGKASLL